MADERCIEYAALDAARIARSLFAHFQRRQIVTKCWRKADGIWCVRDVCYIEDWTDAEYARVAAQLRRAADAGGLVLGAFANGELKGFACVDAALIGADRTYADLALLHVSADLRGSGIGRTLFGRAAAWARARGAAKLYISAHSAVETQAFYRAMGCVEAEEYSGAHVEREPCDCQLEYVL